MCLASDNSQQVLANDSELQVSTLQLWANNIQLLGKALANHGQRLYFFAKVAEFCCAALKIKPNVKHGFLDVILSHYYIHSESSNAFDFTCISAHLCH